MRKKHCIQKRIFPIVLLVLFTASLSVAQSQESGVINTTGGTTTQNDVIYEWSIGEMTLIETMINSNAILTNGFLQPVLPVNMITETFIVFPTNILTADGDGVNDTWVIKDIEKFPDNEVRIFDRAGRTVYTAKNYQNSWTGNFDNNPLTEDTYYYVITLRKDGKTELKKGFITIINH